MSLWWQSLLPAGAALHPGGGGAAEDAFQFDAFENAFQGGKEAPAVVVARYARMLMNLLPPGKLWRWIGDALLYKLLAACADELGRLEARSAQLLDESISSTAAELIPEYERELDLPSDGTDAERQARVVALEFAQQGVRPVDFQTALAPLLGQDAVDVVVIERSRADAIAMADDREIYRFFVYRNPALTGTYYLAAAQALVDKIAQSHTKGHVIESVNFLTDDPFSLTDRDVLGA